MRLKIFFITALVIFMFNAKSQTVSWGVKNTTDIANYKISVIDWTQKGLYCLGSDRKDYYFEKLSPYNFKTEYRVKIEPPEIQGYKLWLEHVLCNDEKYVLFYSGFNKKERIFAIYAAEYSVQEGKGTNNLKKIYKGEAHKKSDRWVRKIYVSEDKSKINIQHMQIDKRKEILFENNLLLDNELNEISSKSIAYSYSEVSDYTKGNYMLDNYGTLYFTKSYTDELTIASYDGIKDFDKWEEKIQLDIRPNSDLVSASYCFNQNGDLIIAGFWAEKIIRNNKNRYKLIRTPYKGTFVIRIDKNTKEIKETFVDEFNEEQLELIVPEKQEEDEKSIFQSKSEFGIGEFLKYSNFSIIPRKDNSMLIIAEKFEHKFHESKSGGYYLTSFGEIIVVKLNKQGIIEWCDIVPKAQTAIIHSSSVLYNSNRKEIYRGSEYFSYAYVISGDYIKILYRDIPENLDSVNLSDDREALTRDFMGDNLFSTKVIMCTYNISNGSCNKNIYAVLDNDNVLYKPVYSIYNKNTLETLVFAQSSAGYMYGILK